MHAGRVGRAELVLGSGRSFLFTFTGAIGPVVALLPPVVSHIRGVLYDFLAHFILPSIL